MNARSEQLTDDEIISSLRTGTGSDRAIRYLYRAHFDVLGSYVRHNSGSADDAADIFQEVMMAFVNVVTAGKFRGESSIRTFLYALTRNAWLNELKKRGRTETREMKYEKQRDEQTPDTGQLMEAQEMNSLLMKTLEQLGDACKKILLMYYYENRSMKEILSALPYENEQVVRNKKYKCLKRLEELVVGNRGLYEHLKNR